MNLVEVVGAKFKELFSEQPILVRSPGRVNLIGEHTDYNFGYVLPAAIDKVICLAITPRKDTCCKIFAVDMNDMHEFSLNNYQRTQKRWPNYLMGVIDQLKKAGYKFNGFNCVFGGDIPIGAGLSSSAALEAGLAFALNSIFELEIDDLTLVKFAQRAENEFVGVQCGIMDQYINIFGKSGNVLRIDCRSLECEYYPFDNSNVSLLLFDTGISHALASSEYNQRKTECLQGIEIIKKKHPDVASLRDVSLDMLSEYRTEMDSTIFRRCKYVVEENERVLAACDELKRNDLKAFGQYMFKSHDGLSNEYNVSCKELDYLVELVRDNPHVYGSRMMGGGFGGCTINLVENDQIKHISKAVIEMYKQRFSSGPKIYVTSIGSGTSVIRVNEHATV